MNYFFIFSSCLLLTLFPMSGTISADNRDKEQKEISTVSNVDLKKYSGLWYEIAKIPNRFQKKCERRTTAEYSLREDGRINVLNTCIDKNGRKIQAEGIAKIVDKDSNAKLKVSFVSILGIQLFWGKYWIIGLAEDYSYAVVGTPNRKYGWILSRSPSLPNDTMKQIFGLLETQGYDTKRFVMTKQL